MKSGLPIRETSLAKKLNVDVNIKVTEPGVVPIYECLEAAKSRGYTWFQFVNELDWYDRALCVAHYRMHNLIEAHISAVASVANNPKRRRR